MNCLKRYNKQQIHNSQNRGIGMKTAAWELITPKIAAAYLDHNPDEFFNRKITEKRVGSIAREMSAGMWEATHQGIAFDETGSLIDGQHRLLAIIQSGVTCELLVSRGIKRKAFTVIDSGKNRTGHDLASLAGITYGKVKLATARAMICHSAFPDYPRWVTGVSNAVALRFYSEHFEEQLDRVIPEFYMDKSLPGIAKAHTVAAFVYAMSYSDDVFGLIYKYRTGEGLFRGDPMLALRNASLWGAIPNRAAFLTACTSIMYSLRGTAQVRRFASNDRLVMELMEPSRARTNAALIDCGYDL
jgi:hypothetical protein